jgi:hypothetical protein
MSDDISNVEKVDTKHSIVTGVFLFGKTSATLIIPAEIARQCDLEDKVTIERKYGGIFIHRPSEFEAH